jgi:nucleoid DNA-binding protein
MNEKINIQVLTTLLSEEMKITKKDAQNFLREFFQVMSEGLLNDNLLKIKELGTFKVINVSDRDSINVTTGERVTIPAHKKVSFIPDKAINALLNGSVAHSRRIIEKVPDSTLLQEDIDVFFEELSKSRSADNNRKNVYRNRSENESSFYAKRPILFATVMLFATALLFYGIYCFVVSSSNKQEYRSALQDFVTTINTKPTEDSPKDFTQKETKPPVIQNSNTDKPSGYPELKKIKVKNGEKLTDISMREYGTEVFWVYLYEANKNVIKNSNNIPPDTEIIIPDAKVYKLNKNDPQTVAKALMKAQQLIRSSRK